MISGNADERMAFVLETESHLDGIRQARAEIAGVGTDAEALGGRLAQFSGKSKAAFDAMTAAEKQAFLGFIGIKESAGQAAVALDTQAAAATRVAGSLGNPVFAQSAKSMQAENAAVAQSFKAAHTAGMTWTQFLKANMNPAMAEFGGHAGAMKELGAQWRALATQVTGTNAAVGRSFDPISNKARTAANAMATLSLHAAGLSSGGINSTIAMGSLASSLAHLTSSARLAASASGIGALVVVAVTLLPLLSKLRNESERLAGGFGKAFGGAGEEGAALFLQLARQRRAVAETAVANAPSAFSPRQSDIEERKNRKAALDEAVKDEQTAIEAVFAARRTKRSKDREDAKRDAEQRVQDEIRSRELGEQTRGRTIMLGQERTSPELGAVTGIQMEQAARDAAIDKLEISEAERNRRKVESARLAEAEITKVYDGEAEKRMAKADEEARKHEEVDKRRARKRFDTAKQNIDAIVRAEGSLGQTLKRLALEPIIGELEGIAAREAVKAIASFPDFSAMAIHGAAAVAATAAAREVAGWAGSSSRGGGSAGSGGGGSSGPGSFEPRSSTEGQGSLVVNLYTQNPYGAEQIQQVSYLLQRGEILKRPIPIAPTNGLRVA